METRRAKGDMTEATHFGSAFFASTLRAIILVPRLDQDVPTLATAHVCPLAIG